MPSRPYGHGDMVMAIFFHRALFLSRPMPPGVCWGGPSKLSHLSPISQGCSGADVIDSRTSRYTKPDKIGV